MLMPQSCENPRQVENVDQLDAELAVEHPEFATFILTLIACMNGGSTWTPRPIPSNYPCKHALSNRLGGVHGERQQTAVGSLKSRPTGDRGSSEELVNVRNRGCVAAVSRLYGPEWRLQLAATA